MKQLLNKTYVHNQSIEFNNIKIDMHIKYQAEQVIQSYFNKYVEKGNRLAGQVFLSKIQFNSSINKINIQFFYFYQQKKSKHSIINIETAQKDLCIVLQNLFEKEVDIQMNRIHYPYLNAQILSKYLAHNSKNNTFIHFKKSIFNYPSYHAKENCAYITGIKISLHGRLTTERVIPRKTMKSKIQGTFNIDKETLYVCKGQTNVKNELGQFTIKVEIAQRLFLFINNIL